MIIKLIYLKNSTFAHSQIDTLIEVRNETQNNDFLHVKSVKINT